jgi:hypothetical protein
MSKKVVIDKATLLGIEMLIRHTLETGTMPKTSSERFLSKIAAALKVDFAEPKPALTFALGDVVKVNPDKDLLDSRLQKRFGLGELVVADILLDPGEEPAYAIEGSAWYRGVHFELVRRADENSMKHLESLLQEEEEENEEEL